jgi:hypothetical protein
MITDTSLVQSKKSRLAIDVTESGITTDKRLVQPKKAMSSTNVTELGITTYDRFVQPLKACTPMDLTESGMTIDNKLVQPSKACCPMDVTVSGITTLPLLSGMMKQPPLGVGVGWAVGDTEVGSRVGAGATEGLGKGAVIGAHDPWAQLHSVAPTTYRVWRHGHPEKGVVPNDVIEFGITTEDRLVQP